jgi:hypothetical protein
LTSLISCVKHMRCKTGYVTTRKLDILYWREPRYSQYSTVLYCTGNIFVRFGTEHQVSCTEPNQDIPSSYKRIFLCVNNNSPRLSLDWISRFLNIGQGGIGQDPVSSCFRV